MQPGASTFSGHSNDDHLSFEQPPTGREHHTIEYQGIRYAQDQHDDRDADQPGGYLAAIDIATGARLWRLKVYAIADTRAAGIAPVPIYFRSMRLEGGGDFLEIEDETGRVFRVSLASRSVTQVAGPAATAAPQQPPKAKPMPD